MFSILLDSDCFLPLRGLGFCCHDDGPGQGKPSSHFNVDGQMFNFRQFQKAPKGQGKAKVMCGTALAYEVALATVMLCLKGRWIDRAAADEVRPTLKAKYTKAQSTIPTYFGAGRSGDGVGLWRAGAGAYPPCIENAGLALTRLEQLGHPPATVATLLGMAEADLLAAVAALPPFASFPAKPAAPAKSPPVAAPVAPVGTAAPAAPPAPTPAQAQRDAKKAAEEAAEAARKADNRASIARIEAEREALKTEVLRPEVAAIFEQLADDDETEGGAK